MGGGCNFFNLYHFSLQICVYRGHLIHINPAHRQTIISLLPSWLQWTHKKHELNEMLLFQTIAYNVSDKAKVAFHASYQTLQFIPWPLGWKNTWQAKKIILASWSKCFREFSFAMKSSSFCSHAVCLFLDNPHKLCLSYSYVYGLQ